MAVIWNWKKVQSLATLGTCMTFKTILAWLGIAIGIAVFLYAFFGYKTESYYDDKKR